MITFATAPTLEKGDVLSMSVRCMDWRSRVLRFFKIKDRWEKRLFTVTEVVSPTTLIHKDFDLRD